MQKTATGGSFSVLIVYRDPVVYEKMQGLLRQQKTRSSNENAGFETFRDYLRV